MVTAEQTQIVLADWKILEADLMVVGETVFITMFTKHPEWIQKFSNLGGTSVDEVKGKTALKAHASNVMGRISQYMKCLEKGQMDVLTYLLKAQGCTHKPRGIKEANFRALQKEILPEVFASKLPNFDAKHADAWQAVLGVVVDGIVKHL